MPGFESMRSLLSAVLAMVIVLRYHGAVLPELGGFASFHLQDIEDTWEACCQKLPCPVHTLGSNPAMEVLALLAPGSAELAAFWGIFH